MPGCLMPWCHNAMIMMMSQRHNVTMPMIVMMGNDARWWQWPPHTMMMTWNNTRWWQCPPCTNNDDGEQHSMTTRTTSDEIFKQNLKCHKLVSQDPVKLVCASPKSSGQALVHYFCQNSTLSNLKKFNKNSSLNSVSILHPTTENCPVGSRQCYQIM